MTVIPHRLRVILAVGVLVLATCLAVAGMVSVALSLRVLKDSFGWVKHTGDVLLEVAAIEANLIAAESAERGYLLTRNNLYLRNFADDRGALASQFSALAKLVSDNPGQVQNLVSLHQTTEARLQQMQKINEIGPTHLDAAVAAIQAAEPEGLTEIVRSKLEGFRQVEANLRQLREQKAARDMTTTVGIAVGSTLLALLSGAAGLVVLQRAREQGRERELQMEMAHMARLGMMGETASMLAHELNQPLTATRTYLSGLRTVVQASGMPASDRVVDILKRATAQTQRASDIVRRLRTFVQRGESTKTDETVSVLFDDAVALLGMRSEGLRITTHAAADLPKVAIDRIEIQQVLINLMRNAVEAMHSGSQRELKLSATLTDGRYVQINVQDTGPGLAPEVTEKLFQPFVSTKTDGMGVGLSICRTIILRNGGADLERSQPRRWYYLLVHAATRATGCPIKRHSVTVTDGLVLECTLEARTGSERSGQQQQLSKVAPFLIPRPWIGRSRRGMWISLINWTLPHRSHSMRRNHDGKAQRGRASASAGNPTLALRPTIEWPLPRLRRGYRHAHRWLLRVNITSSPSIRMPPRRARSAGL
jgi:signal transduction histidine kinase